MSAKYAFGEPTGKKNKILSSSSISQRWWFELLGFKTFGKTEFLGWIEKGLDYLEGKSTLRKIAAAALLRLKLFESIFDLATTKQKVFSDLRPVKTEQFTG